MQFLVFLVAGLVCLMLCSVAFFFGRFSQEIAYLPNVAVNPAMEPARAEPAMQVWGSERVQLRLCDT
jgi:hypothetical protein